ncbi:MAG: adaptor protein MecA [Lachnospiraceae bacterium]|jgi:adapter protein MecA 1/2|nr:adaptor protein MecA [Lachnospiraceae bacterium]
MKIEKINENKIRCILTRDDLEVRHIKLSEIAYGSEKARSLFRDMMEQASHQFGFEADNIPLMIEAIPMPNECIILDITKVSDPEELDTRFSRFSQGSGDTPSDPSREFLPDGADEILDLFQKLLEHRLKNAPKETREEQAATLANELDLRKLYLFHRLDSIVEASSVLKGIYHGENRLYKNPDTAQYHLVITKSDHSPEQFNKVCNILSEYGSTGKYSASNEAYMKEHFTLLMNGRALQQLAEI